MIETVFIYQFTGTLHSFKKMAKKLGLCPYKRNYKFLDKEYNESTLFQGIVMVDNIIYQKNDHYIVKVKD